MTHKQEWTITTYLHGYPEEPWHIYGTEKHVRKTLKGMNEQHFKAVRANGKTIVE